MDAYFDQTDDKLEMLKWISDKNGDIPMQELAGLMEQTESDEQELDEMLYLYGV